MNTESIVKIAKKMKMFGLAEAVEPRLASAKRQSLSYEEFLSLLLDDEAQDRRNKTALRMISRAKFRHQHAIEDWDMSFDRGIDKQELRSVSSLNFYQNRENLILLGSTGCGKSHLAVSLGRRLCSQEISVRFFSVNLFFEEVAAQQAAGRYLNFLKISSKHKVIIMDDFGLRNYTHKEATALLDLLENRDQNGIVIITSQVKPEGWKSLFKDQVIADAIVDRLTNPSHQIELRGDSYRTKISKKAENKLDE